MDIFEEGRAHFEQRNYVEAVRCFYAVPDTAPVFARSRVGLGRALYQLGRLEEALAAFEQGIPTGGASLSLLLMGQAIALSDLGRTHDARTAFNEAVAVGPRTASLLYNRGQFFLRIGANVEAGCDFLAAHELDPADDNSLCYAALATSNAGSQELAIEYGEAALRLNPRNAAAHDTLGLAHGRLGRLAEALQHSNAAIALDPRRAAYYYNRGCSHQQLRSFAAAIADFSQALALAPQHAKSLTNRGNCLLAFDRDEEALADFTEAIRLGDTISYLNRGNTYLRLERYQEALDDLTQAIHHHPENTTARIARSFAYDELGRIAESEADYRHALGLDGPRA